MIRKTIIFLIYILCFDINCLCIEPSTDRITKDSTIVHIVRKGETVYSIAREHHLTVDHILSCHPELKEGTLCEDDTLEFPCIASSSTKATDPYTTMSPTVNGSLDGYNYVDLGLQSGLKWATCNIGTANPWEYGDYFSWGETNNKRSSHYRWRKGEKFSGSHYTGLTKYCTDSEWGYVDNKTTLDLNDDAAHKNMGEHWRMPTIKEFDELIDCCDWKWVNNYLGTGISGQLGISKANGRAIFFPAGGNIYDKENYYSQIIGLYWSSSLCIDFPCHAEAFEFDSSLVGTNIKIDAFRDFEDIDWEENCRIFSLNVRAVSNYTIPVCEKGTSISTDKIIVTGNINKAKNTNNNYNSRVTIITLIILIITALAFYIWHQLTYEKEEYAHKETLKKQQKVGSKNQQSKVSAGKQQRLKNNNTIIQQKTKSIEASSNCGLSVDNRNTFYRLEDINSVSIGEGIMIAPYDARWLGLPDAKVLPLLTESPTITKYLPHLGFSDESSTRKQLLLYCYKTENQLGVTYVIRIKNIPIGMIFINTPLFNKKAINIAIWTVDFYISQMFEHKGIMYNSLTWVLNEMKKKMGAVKIYAMVDSNNESCKKLLSKALFVKIDNTNFYNSAAGGNKPLVFEFDLSKAIFIRQ